VFGKDGCKDNVGELELRNCRAKDHRLVLRTGNCFPLAAWIYDATDVKSHEHTMEHGGATAVFMQYQMHFFVLVSTEWAPTSLA
jgi:hypothetical protein